MAINIEWQVKPSVYIKEAVNYRCFLESKTSVPNERTVIYHGFFL